MGCCPTRQRQPTRNTTRVQGGWFHGVATSEGHLRSELESELRTEGPKKKRKKKKKVGEKSAGNGSSLSESFRSTTTTTVTKRKRRKKKAGGGVEDSEALAPGVLSEDVTEQEGPKSEAQTQAKITESASSVRPATRTAESRASRDSKRSDDKSPEIRSREDVASPKGMANPLTPSHAGSAQEDNGGNLVQMEPKKKEKAAPLDYEPLSVRKIGRINTWVESLPQRNLMDPVEFVQQRYPRRAPAAGQQGAAQSGAPPKGAEGGS